jgi:hypothetical protein
MCFMIFKWDWFCEQLNRPEIAIIKCGHIICLKISICDLYYFLKVIEKQSL